MIKDLSLVHEISEPSSESGGPPPLLLLLHGIGSNEFDLLSLAPELDGRLFCVSARAPHRMGEEAYAWFHVQAGPEGPVIRADEAEASRLLLLRFIDELVAEYRLDAKRVFLMGFSQGAVIGLSVALTSPERVAGIVAMSGRLLPEVLPLVAGHEALSSLSVFIAHGIQDGVLPIGYGRAARDRLSSMGVDLDYREYPMGHEVASESLRDISFWLAQKIAR